MKYLFIQIVIAILILAGEIQCIYKALNCNWDPIGKAEIVYTASAVTGFGAITGWFNIKDN